MDAVEFQFSKTGLVPKLLEATGMDNWYKFPTSTRVYVTLGKDDNNTETNMYCPNVYPYVIGMMWYLESDIRPYITFAVRWCDQVTHETKA